MLKKKSEKTGMFLDQMSFPGLIYTHQLESLATWQCKNNQETSGLESPAPRLL